MTETTTSIGGAETYPCVVCGAPVRMGQTRTIPTCEKHRYRPDLGFLYKHPADESTQLDDLNPAVTAAIIEAESRTDTAATAWDKVARVEEELAKGLPADRQGEIAIAARGVSRARRNASLLRERILR